MVFMPGQSGNLLGRPKKIDVRSEDLQAFFKKHRESINKVGEIVLQRAIEGEEPWAIKLCMEYFYPKPGTSSMVTTESNTEVNVNLNSFGSNLSHEDQQTFLKLWMKSKRGIPAFKPTHDGEAEEELETEIPKLN